MRGSIVDMFQMFFAGLGAALGFLIGGFDIAIIVLIAFVVIDYLTGVIKAVYTKKLSSEVGFTGILKKLVIFMVVIIGHLIDSLLPGELTGVRTMIIFFYISNEGISIIENCAAIGIPIPQKIVKVLQQLQQNDDEEVEG